MTHLPDLHEAPRLDEQSAAHTLHQVITLGYRTPGAMEQVQAQINAGACLVDIRLVPHSRFLPHWRRAALAARFGTAYHHLPALGNVHYRTPEQPMRLRDATQGLEYLVVLLRERNVLLLCGCPDPETCHRSLVCQLIQERVPGLSITHLVLHPSPEPHWQERPFSGPALLCEEEVQP